jgi:hypothetical protein
MKKSGKKGEGDKKTISATIRHYLVTPVDSHGLCRKTKKEMASINFTIPSA